MPFFISFPCRRTIVTYNIGSHAQWQGKQNCLLANGGINGCVSIGVLIMY
jgi:hypothetical protein